MKNVKTGADHLESLRDGRNIIIDGEVVRIMSITPPSETQSVAPRAYTITMPLRKILSE